MRFLRQSTASQTRTIGPFLDSTDFVTAETALTIANTDVRLKKNGADDVAKNSGGATHDVNGCYHLTFDATDTDTVGELYYTVSVAGALQVFGAFTVLEEAIYDALFGASANAWTGAAGSSVGAANVTQWLGTAAATPTVAGVPEVDVTHVGGTAQTAGDIIGDTNDIQARLPAALVSGRIDASVGAMATDVITNTALAASAVTEIQSGLATSSALSTAQTDITTILADTNELQTDWANGGRLDLILDARMAKTDLLPVSASVNDAGASTTVFITTLPSTVTNFYKDWQLIFTSGALAGVPKVISSYNGTTKAVTLSEALTSAPANGVTFDLFSNHTHAQADIASSVWTSVSRTLTAGTNIQLPSNGLDNINTWTVALIGNITGSLSGSVGSVSGNVGGNVVGSVGSVLGGINTTSGVITTLDGLDTAQDTQHSTTQSSIAALPTVTQIWTTALTEAYRSTGAAGTAAQLLHEILQNLTEFAIVSTTKTVKKFDGSTTAKTYTLDSSSAPTSITETT